MRYALILAGFLMMLSCSRDRETLLKEAIKLDSLERFHEAIAIYDELLEQDSSNASILVARAYDKALTGDQSGEIQDLKRAVSVGSGHALPMLELGIIYGDLGQYAESIEWFNRAINVKTYGSSTVDWADNPFLDRKRHLLDVPMVEIILERGIIYYKADSVRNAYDDLTYCIEKNHELKDSYYYRARTYLKSNMLKQACEDLKMAEMYGQTDATEILEKYCR